MTAPDTLAIEGVTAVVQVPPELRSLVDRAADIGDMLVMVARRFAQLQVQIDEQILALAKANGENGDGEVLAQIQSDLSDPVDRTVSLVTGIVGFYGEADPDCCLVEEASE